TQKPGGTRMPSIRRSSPRFAPFPPTLATWVWSISSNRRTGRPIHSLVRVLVRHCAPTLPVQSGADGRPSSSRLRGRPGHSFARPVTLRPGPGLAASPQVRDTLEGGVTCPVATDLVAGRVAADDVA